MENYTPYKYYENYQQDFYKFAETAIPKIQKKMYSKNGKLKREYRGATKIEIDRFLALIFSKGEKFWQDENFLNQTLEKYKIFRAEAERRRKMLNIPKEQFDQILAMAFEKMEI